MLSTPNDSFIIDGYETRNLNKSAYLLMRGAIYKDVYDDEEGRNTFVLDNVNRRHVDEFWKDALTVEFWTFWRKRSWLKEQIKAKTEEK